MEDCIFCKIIKGEIPSYTIYENDNIKVFMDVKPITRGHSLMVPKKHYTDLFDIEPEILREMDEIAKELYPKYKANLGAEGITRMQNNELGQEVKHYHMHLIPRYANDNLKLRSAENTEDASETYEHLK